MNNSQDAAADPALIELFRAELDAHLPVLSDGLLALEKGRIDEQTIAGMMRAAHSIKGAARIVGLEKAVRVAHVLEDCLTAAKEKRITLQSAAIDVLLQGVDALQRICLFQPGAPSGLTNLDELLERIVGVRDGRTPSSGQESLDTATSPTSAAEPGELVINLPPVLDDEAAEYLRKRMDGAFREKFGRMCLDFTGVNFVSAQALAVLISLLRQDSGTHSMWAVRGVGGEIARLLRVSGLEYSLSSGN